MIPFLDKMKVLAVDDNRTNLHILQVFLKKLGHEVILAENGQEAVQRFQTDAPDLVLLDIMMPVMDGFEAARRIKSINSERWTPIIFLSALNRDENLVEGLEAGADDYLTKPINFVVLEAKLRSMQRALAMQQGSIDALRRVQTISDNVMDAIVTIDEACTIVSVNRSTERVFGWSANELLGRDIGMLMSPQERAETGQHLGTYRTGVSSRIVGQERETMAVRKNGEHFPITLGVTEIVFDNKTMMIGVIRDISERKAAEKKLRENAELLQRYYDQTQTEQQLALRLLDKQLHRPGLQSGRLRYKVLAAENFSGDIVAATRSPEGRYYALLADATGHGLTAAISVLPVVALFYRMARLNSPLREMLWELNQQLVESMPVGRFVAATLLSLDEMSQEGEIWVGGTPEAFLFDAQGKLSRSFASENLPLGIVSNDQLADRPTRFTWSTDSQLVLCSDGLLEASNRDGAQFGARGLIIAASECAPNERFECIEAALNAHLDGSMAADDISLMVIDCP